MKTVTLIGDSIRKGYQSVVQHELSAIAQVWAPQENCHSSRDILAHLQEWAIARKPDLIHINCGLHDLKKAFGQSQCAVPVAEYERNVREILNRLKAQTTATLIWASTTPVNEQNHHERKGFDRSNSDVSLYNTTAERIATELDIPINNLLSVAQAAIRAGLQRPDGVHFTPEGYVQLGKAVAQSVERELKKS